MTNTAVIAAEAQTPRISSFFKNNVFWVVLGIGILFLGVVTLLVSGMMSSAARLAPDNPKSNGAQAVVRVLEQQGVQVEASTSLSDTLELLSASGSERTTVVLYDGDSLLNRAQYQELYAATEHLVSIEPDFTTLDAIFSDVFQAGHGDPSPQTAACTLPAAQRAGTITGGGLSYRTFDLEASGCFAANPGTDEDPSFSLLRYQDETKTISILGAGLILENGVITQEGNAALALNLLGEHEHLIWYIPGILDLSSPEESLEDLIPGWFTPVMILGLVVTIAAAFWRGRRQGRLVVENLPVTVPASETLEGRARLYQQAEALNHSLDYVRMGSLNRIAKMLGLASTASVPEIIDRIVAHTGWDRKELFDLYLNIRVENETALLHFSDQLAHREAELQRGVSRW